MSAFAHMGSGGCNFMMRGSWTKKLSIFIIRILRSLDLCTFQVTIYNLNILKFITKMCEFRKMINFGGCLKIMKIHWNFRGLWFLSVGQSKQIHKHGVIGFYHTCHKQLIQNIIFIQQNHGGNLVFPRTCSLNSIDRWCSKSVGESSLEFCYDRNFFQRLWVHIIFGSCCIVCTSPFSNINWYVFDSRIGPLLLPKITKRAISGFPRDPPPEIEFALFPWYQLQWLFCWRFADRINLAVWFPIMVSIDWLTFGSVTWLIKLEYFVDHIKKCER